MHLRPINLSRSRKGIFFTVCNESNIPENGWKNVNEISYFSTKEIIRNLYLMLPKSVKQETFSTAVYARVFPLALDFRNIYLRWLIDIYGNQCKYCQDAMKCGKRMRKRMWQFLATRFDKFCYLWPKKGSRACRLVRATLVEQKQLSHNRLLLR